MTSAGKQGGPAAPAPDPGGTSEVLVQSDRAWNGAVYPAYPVTRPHSRRGPARVVQASAAARKSTKVRTLADRCLRLG